MQRYWVFRWMASGVMRHSVKRENYTFTLLADFEPKGAVSKIYGVYNEKKGQSERALFVLDAEGIIRWNYLSPVGINPGADGILEALEMISSKK